MQNLNKTVFSWYFVKIVIIRRTRLTNCERELAKVIKGFLERINERKPVNNWSIMSFSLSNSCWYAKLFCVQFSFDTFLSDCVQIYLVGSRDEQVEELCSSGRRNIWNEGVELWIFGRCLLEWYKEILAWLCACNTLWRIQYSACLLHFMSS